MVYKTRKIFMVVMICFPFYRLQGGDKIGCKVVDSLLQGAVLEEILLPVSLDFNDGASGIAGSFFVHRNEFLRWFAGRHSLQPKVSAAERML